MKKSIVAMLSITALAIVANAEVSVLLEPTGTHFEGTTIGAPLYANCDDSGVYSETEGPFFWYASTNWTAETAQADTTTQFGTYTNFWGEYSGDRPEIAGRADTTNRCLLIDTEGGRLFRRICGATDSGEGLSAFQQYSVTNAVYFDSLVQFTVNEDEAPTIQTGDKLAVWLQGGETTNLVVTAGYFNSVDALVATNYVVTINNEAVTLEPGTWHRLTIEAINIFDTTENAFVGFRIYVDGTLLHTGSAISANPFKELSVFDDFNPTDKATSYAQEGVLFPALYSTGANHGSISCVAFEGTGAIDDLTFTDTNPFAVAPSANPTVDGTPLAPADVFFTNGVAAARTDRAITYPSAPVLSGEVGSQKITFGGTEVTVPAYYTATLANTVITLALNTNAIPAIAAATVESEAKEAIEVDAATFTATLDSTYPNLYYGLKVASAPNAAEANWTRGTLEQGTGSPMQISADKPTVSGGSDPAPAGFFKVYVTDVNE